LGGRRGRDRMIVLFTTAYATVPITTKAVSLNSAHSEVYSIPHYVIKFVTNKTDRHNLMEILLKVT